MDANNCYYEGNKIKNAESNSFKLLEQKDGNENTPFAKDNNAYYDEGKSTTYSKIKEYLIE
ncbi:DKNYY domain-containing protein [Chryseobacterium cucumeris]